MDETFDFVVIGSGGGALCAALFMATAGRRVLVLEKADLVGGTTATSGGVMWIPDNRYMKTAGIADSREAATAYLDAVVGDAPDAKGGSRARRIAYVEEANRMVDFLVDRGVRLRKGPLWPDYYSDAPGASAHGRTVVAELFDTRPLGEWASRVRPGFLPVPARLEEAMMMPKVRTSWAARRTMARVVLRTIVAKLRRRTIVSAGSALVGQVLDAALRAGVEIRTGAAVRELIVENDRVTGVTATVDGAMRRIGARAGVLIAAGGFSRNQTLHDTHATGGSAEWTRASDADTGDLIEAATAIGAATAQMDTRLYMAMALMPTPAGNAAVPIQNDIAKPHGIVVDQSGRRFVSEANSYMEFCGAMLRHDRETPAVPSWFVLDSQFLAKSMLAGTMPGKKKPQGWFDSKFVRRADTLSGLAAEIGVDAGRLQQTVDRFNGFARSGRDEDFGRGATGYQRWMGDADHTPSPNLGTIEQGPFYAMQVYPGDVGVLGGLVTDTDARVLRDDDTPIDGLYATGTASASVFGRTSPGAGSSIGPTLTWGYVAARHAANAGNRPAAA